LVRHGEAAPLGVENSVAGTTNEEIALVWFAQAAPRFAKDGVVLIHSVFDVVRARLILVRFVRRFMRRRQSIQIDFLSAFDADRHAIDVKLSFLTTANALLDHRFET